MSPQPLLILLYLGGGGWYFSPLPTISHENVIENWQVPQKPTMPFVLFWLSHKITRFGVGVSQENAEC